MIKLIALLSACIMLLSGCGCTNDTNNDGIVGNDQAPNDSVMDDNADEGIVNNDTMMDDNFADNGDMTDNNSATDTTGARSGGIVGRAMNGVGNAVEDIGRGANNVMQDVGNALR